jgi:SHAQKYF class myb-like DNA-binding protein
VTVTIDPSTPGRVVEAGEERTGRWSVQEHIAFLDAVQLYGKNFKKVAAKVKTRTIIQTRSHAQKYFEKLQGRSSLRKSKVMDNAATSLPGPQEEEQQKRKKRRISLTPRSSGQSSNAILSAAEAISALSGNRQPQGVFAVMASSSSMMTGHSLS